VLVVAAVVIGGYVAFSGGGSRKDYSGDGSGTTTAEVNKGDGIDAIAKTLVTADVVGSAHAFKAAAAANPASDGIQPGFYRLRKHMSGRSALSLLLNPSVSLINTKVTIPEGLTEKDIVAKIATALAVSPDVVQKAADDVSDLAPGGYSPASGSLSTLEGFLYPATYTFDPATSPNDAIQQLVTAYTSEDRQLGFASGAAKLSITPYQALIIASIAQAEVKFADDAPKVARVILNRLAQNMPLQIDATSVYGAELKGLDPAKVTYSTLDSPFNTYTNKGLPPTPIGNPGETSMQGAISPSAGTWLFYVNGDAAGHLAFFSDADAFKVGQQKCHDNNWGCAAP